MIDGFGNAAVFQLFQICADVRIHRHSLRNRVMNDIEIRRKVGRFGLRRQINRDKFGPCRRHLRRLTAEGLGVLWIFLLNFFFRYALYLLAITTFCITSDFILKLLLHAGKTFSNITWLAISFYLTNVLCLFIFFKGQQREIRKRPFYTMISTSLKFLIELIIAMAWFLIAKKTSISSILLFFVLYLTFTSFSIFMILKTLKNKSL